MQRTGVVTYAAARRQGHVGLRFAAMAFASDQAMQGDHRRRPIARWLSDIPVERMMRDAKIAQTYEGANQVQRIVMACQVRAGAQGL